MLLTMVSKETSLNDGEWGRMPRELGVRSLEGLFLQKAATSKSL